MEQEPLYDGLFGELNYDPPMEEWYAEVVFSPGHEVDIAIWWSESENGPFPPVLQRAREAYQRFSQHESNHRERLAAAMIERYREFATEELPTTAEVARGLRVERLAIAPDGSATAHYDDAAELFGDHCIWADLDTNGSFIGFSIQG
jgi:hypothetical protein